MNWEAIGATGEVLGAIAVVISVLYLAFQIRHNTQQLKEDQRDRTQDQMTEMRALILQRDIAELVVRANSGEELDPADQWRFSTWLYQFVWTYYQVWDRYKEDPSNAVWFKAAGPILARTLYSDGALPWWRENQSQWEHDFILEVERLHREELDDT